MKKTIISATVLLLLVVPTTVWATNESSYKYEYEQGKDEWVNCITPDDDCGTPDNDCLSPVVTSVGDGTSHYHEIDHYDIMTNKTACADGFRDGWNQYM